MRLAVAGKGGAGKTTISATLSRLAAQAGVGVVAVDADANPNLSTALGLPPEAASQLTPLPAGLVSRRRGGPGLTVGIDAVLAEYALRGPDGVQLVGMGGPAHAEEGCLCSAHAVISALLEDLDSSQRFVVVDMEASPEHLSRGTVRHVDAVCLVAEPYYRSLETVRRMSELVAQLPVPRVFVLANKVRSSEDAAGIAEFCDRHRVHLAGTVPWSDAVLEADRTRTPVVDYPAAGEVVEAVATVVAELLGPSLRSRWEPAQEVP